MKTNPVRLVDEFMRLVEIDSPTYGERQMADYVMERMRALGLFVLEDDAGDKIGGTTGNIYGLMRGDDSIPPLMFCAHLDTVEPSRGKRAVLAPNGRITSAGDTVLGADDLTAVAAILEALTVLSEGRLRHGPIEVLFTVAEEVYCRGSRVFDFSKVLSEQAYVLDLAGPVGTAAYAAPSIVTFTVTVRGRAAHAGFEPQRGVHAIAAAAEAITRMKLGFVDEETTVNIGLIEGGKATNIVPETCIVRGEVRSLRHDKAMQRAQYAVREFERAAKAVGAEVESEITIAATAYETPQDHPVVTRFEQACRSIKLTTSLIKTFGGSDNNEPALNNITGLVVANAMFRCHSTKEYTTVEELTRAAELTLALMTADA
ncbi:MAG TPA: M20/M25/M40 family metallo-hydrolase [Papillibacter sp.]|nr:M20/M25/M40 family metallo-hydrolase [Papillibacter sp.]